VTQVMDVNTNGVLYTAQAAGRQMVRFGIPGSIILVASMSGSITNKVRQLVDVTTKLVIDKNHGYTGSRLGAIQCKQVRSASIDTQYGV
jgi:NAD(P)-dependent dehydrogenase (short-subunit alcohol dehydrogenase family)